jgi:hypothetical protein
MIDRLDDEDKIKLTESSIIPSFLENAYSELIEMKLTSTY